MSVRSAKGMASASVRLSRPLSTTSNAASLSKRLRSHWRSATSSNTAAASPAQTESSSASSPSGSSTPSSQPSTASASSAKAPPRKAASRALRYASNSTRANAPRKFVASYDKGKAKEQGGAQSAADHSASMLKELNALDDLLDSLQSKAFAISQRLKALELSRPSSKDQMEEAWGPDRLAPPNLESTWSAGPAGSDTSSKPSDKKAGEPTTRLVFGDSLLAESSLRWRDSKGKTVEGVTYSGPFADEIRRYTESITGCVTANNVPVDKVAPLREMEVAKLAHGLDRVLFNPGVYWLRDPRSGIYNFDPRIKDILDVDLFDYAALPPYITSSKDPELAKLTKQHAKKYCGSTSSMTSLLSQCYFLISGWRNPDTSGFSAPFAGLPSGFSVGAKLPASILLNYKDGFYAIDADKASAGEAENNNYVLTSLGKSMEKMLTATPDEYAKYQRINSWKLSEEERTKPEAYHYACTGNMMMRSQLDCHDERLPHKTFDLKTRASIGIRNDRANYVEGSGYQIRRAQGLLESFEREYFDMVRAAFLKYNFQVRIGHMDGIFVAYHTTSTIFGFQYISVDEMNERLFGSQDMADQAFKLSLGMMEAVLDAATSMFPEKTLKITIEAKDKSDTGMVVYVEPADQDTATESNAAHQASAEEGAKAGGGGKSIVQLDITVDRYLDGGLVLGPVDFSFLPGRRIDPMNEDEIERRLRQSLPPVRWEVDYRISPRSDLTEAKIRANLQAVRDRQASLGSLILPNVEALNEREQYRTTELSKNPEALRRFLEERASGVAAGMPLAPGQHSAEATSAEAAPQDALVAADKSPRRKQAETRFIRMRNIRTLRLRELAKLGAKDATLQKSTDKHILYQPQS